MPQRERAWGQTPTEESKLVLFSSSTKLGLVNFSVRGQRVNSSGSVGRTVSVIMSQPQKVATDDMYESGVALFPENLTDGR